MMRNTSFIILAIIIFFLTQSCATLNNIWSEAKELPKLVHRDSHEEVGYPGVPIIKDQKDAEDSKGLTGFVAVSRHTIYGSDKWYDPVGIQAGVIYPFYRINNFLDLRAEANVSMQGAKWEEEDAKGRTNLVYINLPVLVRYQTDFGLFAEAGLQPGFLVSAKKYEGTVNNIMVNMRKPDLSISFGIGYEFKSNFGAGIRVITGLTDITKYAAGNDRNFVIALRGTYTFKMK